MPMSGAPRTASRRMAAAVSSAPSSVSHTSAPGRSVWSRTASPRPSQRRATWDCEATDIAAAYPPRARPLVGRPRGLGGVALDRFGVGLELLLLELLGPL